MKKTKKKLSLKVKELGNVRAANGGTQDGNLIHTDSGTGTKGGSYCGW